MAQPDPKTASSVFEFSAVDIDGQEVRISIIILMLQTDAINQHLIFGTPYCYSLAGISE
jgi:hypothetical protein